MTTLFALLASKLSVAGAAAKTGIAVAAVAATTATAGAVGALPGSVQDGFDRAVGSDSAEVLETEVEQVAEDKDTELERTPETGVTPVTDTDTDTDSDVEVELEQPAADDAVAGGPKEGSFGARVSADARGEDGAPGVDGQQVAEEARAKSGGSDNAASAGSGQAQSEQARERGAEGRERGAAASEQGRARGGAEAPAEEETVVEQKPADGDNE